MNHFLLLICFITISGVATPANANPATTPETPATTLTMRLAALPKMDMLYVKAMKRMARAIEESSGKQIKPELFTHGQQGSEESALQKQMQGNLEGGFTSALTLARQLPAFRVLATPLLFTKPEHVRNLINSPLDTALRDLAKTKNLLILGYASFGFYGVLSFRPIDQTNPLPSWDNLTTRIPQDDWMTEVHQALALRPLTMPIADLSNLLASGWIQGIAASPEMLSHTPFPTTAAVYFNTHHLHGWSLFTVNLEWFEKLPPDLQTAITNAVNSVLTQTLEQSFTLELTLLNQWSTKNQLSVITPPPEETASRLQETALKNIQEMEKLLNLPGVVSQLWQNNVQAVSMNKSATHNKNRPNSMSNPSNPYNLRVSQ